MGLAESVCRFCIKGSYVPAQIRKLSGSAGEPDRHEQVSAEAHDLLTQIGADRGI